MNKLTISLAAIADNYKTLREKFTGVECGAVVKANGYGLGVLPIAEHLQKTSCKKFFVATLEEGIELRKTIKSDIFIFHGAQKNELDDFKKYKLIPVLNNPEQLAIWPKTEPAALHFDTGMTRLGFDNIIDAKDYNIVLVMSHLAIAEDKNNPKNAEQLQSFKKIASAYPNIPKSLCNSYGISLPKEFHFDIARPGIELYGGNRGKNVVKLEAPIIQIHEIDKTKTVGYGGEYTAQKGDVTATIPLGYADGILRTLGNKGKVYCGKYELPIIGRVSMDLITIKLNNLPPAQRKLGTLVEILGEKYNICDMAEDAGTIEYEVITRLGNRFKRIYA